MDKIKASQAVKEFLRKIASQGGKARNKSLTPERRSEIARMGGRPKKEIAMVVVDEKTKSLGWDITKLKNKLRKK